jgi:hypothetical protein
MYCSNTQLHPRPFRLRWRVYWWNHRPMCRKCYRFFCQNIRVVRTPKPRPMPPRPRSPQYVSRRLFARWLRILGR